MNKQVATEASLRSPEMVMRLSRMGSMFPSRLSFLRSMIRQLIAEKSVVHRPHWDMTPDGYGTAVYSIDLGGHTYSLFAVTNELDPNQRTDRVIAQAWDAAFVLYDGVPDAAEITRLAKNAPLQEAGRFCERDLCLSRANKSVRLFDAVVSALRKGGDLPVSMIQSIGYLMRTTAVYGNGKFGIADRADFADRPGLQGPFMAEMLTVWLIRTFTHDLVEHVGQGKLPTRLKRHLGIGNSTGLGMAPFLVSHPLLLHSWMVARETAVSRVRCATVSRECCDRLHTLARRVSQHLLEWNVPDPVHQARIVALRRDWAVFYRRVQTLDLTRPGALDGLIVRSQIESEDLQELVISWLLEPFGELVDGLTECMANPFEPRLDAAMSCDGLREIITGSCAYALDVDFTTSHATQQFWYVSEAKLEPRIGQRHEEDGADRESPLDVTRKIQQMADDLNGVDGPVWAFLARFPEHRFAVQRVQALAKNPYSEIQDNLIDGDTFPIDMLRCKLSFFGASKFDPKSNLWTRITLAQGAPLAEELADGSAIDDWWLPVMAP